MISRISSRRIRRSQIRSMLALAVAGVGAILPQILHADQFKANTDTVLAHPAAWGGTAPGVTDLAIFGSSTNAGPFTLGGNLTWLGMALGSGLSQPVTLTGGSTLTLGTSGLDMSSANQMVTLNTSMLLANGSQGGQIWNVASSTLSLGGAVNLGGGSLILNGNSTVSISGALSNGTLALMGNTVSMSGADNLSQLIIGNSNSTFLSGSTRTVGTMTWYGGTLGITTADAFGGGTVRLAGGTLNYSNTTSPSLVINNSMQLLGGNLILQMNTNNTFTFNGTVSTAVSSTLTLATTGTVNMTGSLISTVANSSLTLDTIRGLFNFSGNGSMNGAFILASGTMVISGSLGVNAGNFGTSTTNTSILGTGTTNVYVNINGGTLNNYHGDGPYPALTIGGSGAATALYVHNGGALISNGQLGISNGVNGYGALTLDGGTVTSANAMSLGGNNDYGVFNMKSGIANILAGGGLNVYISGGGTAGSQGVGVLNVSGGTMTVNQPTDVGQYGGGVINISGGWYRSTSTVILAENNATSIATAIVNLNGGALQTTQIFSNRTTNGFANFNGGLLLRSGTTSPFLNTSFTATVWTGGLNVYSGVNANTIFSTSLLAPTGSGVDSITLAAGAGTFSFLDTPVIWITSGGTGSGASAVANLDVNGFLTGITVTNRGNGYSSAGATVSLFYNSATLVPLATAVMGDNSNATMSGAANLVGSGSASVYTMRTQNTYTGKTIVSRGTLFLDFSTNQASVLSNIILPSTTMVLNGATLTMNGTTNATLRSQTFAATVIGPGAPSSVGLNQVTATNATSPTYLNLGALSQLPGGYVDFTATGNSVATAAITTTTTNGAYGILGGWATYQIANGTNASWAVSNIVGGAPGTISGLSIATGYNNTVGAGGNENFTAGTYAVGGSTFTTLRMADNATTYSFNAGGGGLTLVKGGIMWVGNSTYSATISGDSLSTLGSDLVVIQNVTGNTMTISSNLDLSGGGGSAIVKTGAGMLLLQGTGTAISKVALYGGTLGISDATELGQPAPSSYSREQILISGNDTLKLFTSVAASNSGMVMVGNLTLDTQANNATFGQITSTVPVANTMFPYIGSVPLPMFNGAEYSLNKRGTGVLSIGDSGTNQSFLKTITVGGGTLRLTGYMALDTTAVSYVGDTANVPATLLIDGGTLTNAANPGFDVASGSNSVGIVVVNSGVMQLSNALNIAWGPNAADFSSYGALLISGGTLLQQSWLGLGSGQAANSAGVAFFRMTGGTLIGNTGNQFQIGANNGTAGKLHAIANFEGGLIGWQNDLRVGDANTGIANFMGTTASANQFTIGNGGSSGGSELNLLKGVLTGQVAFNSGPNSFLNFNGGTLAARVGIVNLLPYSTNGKAYVWPGGANFVANGTSNITAPLMAPNVNGISGLSSYPANTTFSTVTVSFVGGLDLTNPFTQSATAVVTLVNNTVGYFQITNPGYGYVSNPTINFSGQFSTISTTANISTLQGINSTQVAYSSTGTFAAPPLVNIIPAANGTSTGGGTGASGYAVLDPATGKVANIVITNPGTGYTTVTDNSGNTFYPTAQIIYNGFAETASVFTGLLGANSGGGVTQTGAGTITYSSSASNFTGPVNVNGGLMILSGTFNGTSLATVSSAAMRISGKVSSGILVNGGTLDMNGGLVGGTVSVYTGGLLTSTPNGTNSGTILGAVVVKGGGSLGLANGTIGTFYMPAGLTIGNATLSSGLTFDVTSAAADLLNLGAGTFAVNGTASIHLNFNGSPATGLIQLATFATPSGLSGLSLDTPSLKYGFSTISLDKTESTFLALIVASPLSPDNALWTGQFGTNWDTVGFNGTGSQFNSDYTTNAGAYPGTQSTVVFTSNVTPAPINLSSIMNGSWSIKGVTVSDNWAASAITIDGGGSTLSVGSGGIVNNSTGAVLTFNTTVALTATQTWSNISTVTPITVGSVVGTSSTAALSLASGKFALNGGNTAGPTFVANATVSFGGNATLGGTSGIMNLNTGGFIEVNGQVVQVGGLYSTDSSVIINNTAGTGTFVVYANTGNTNTYAGTFQDNTTNNSLQLRMYGNGSLTLTNNSSLNGGVRVDSGTLLLPSGAILSSPGGSIWVGTAANSVGYLKMNGATLNAIGPSPSLLVGNGLNTTGILVLDGNSYVKTTGELDVGQSSDSASGSYGAIILNGGTISHASFLGLGHGSAGGAAVEGMLIMNGGYIEGTGGNGLQVGAYQGVAGQIHGEALLFGGNIVEQNLYIGHYIRGIANMQGTNVTANTVAFGASGGAGILNLNAGVLTTGAVTWANTQHVFNFNGGTLRNNNVGGNLIAAANGAGKMYAWKDVLIDSNTSSTTIAEGFLTPGGNGVGAMTLATNSGYTSAPTVVFNGGGGFGAAATATFDANSSTVTGIVITNFGTGYTGNPTVSLTGGAGTQGFFAATATATANTASSGIVTIPITNSGSGYLALPLVAIYPASGGGQTGLGMGASGYAILDGSGHLTGITITSPGVGYNTVTDGTTTYYPTVSIIGGGATTTAVAGQVTLGANGDGGGLTLFGLGTVTLSATNNTYRGDTNINSGKMNLSGSVLTSPNWNVSSAATMTSTGTLATGTFNLNGVATIGGSFTASNAIIVGALGTVAALTTTGVVNTGVLNVSGSTSTATLGGTVSATSINVTASSLTSTGVINVGTFNAGGPVTVGGSFNASTAINVLNGGTFLANGSVVGTTVSVQSGGSLGGKGTLSGPVTVFSGGQLNTMDGAAATLTLVDNLNLNSGSLVKLDLGDLVSVGTAGTMQVVATSGVSLSLTGNGTAGSSYIFMTYNNATNPTFNFSNHVGFNPATLTPTATASYVTITSNATAPNTAYFRNNFSDLAWSTVVNAAQSNWSVDAAGTIPVWQLPGSNTDVYLNGDGLSYIPTPAYQMGQDYSIKSLNVNYNVNNAATLSGSGALTIGSGGINLSQHLTINSNVIAGVSQNWSQQGYNLIVTGALSSPTSINLVKSGYGTLSLNGNNTGLQGTINLQGGTIALGAGSGLGNSSLSFYMVGSLTSTNAGLQLNGNNVRFYDFSGDGYQDEVINNGAAAAVLTVGDSGINRTFAGYMKDSENSTSSASLGLVKRGPGSLTVTGSLTYTGPTTVTQGWLILSPQYSYNVSTNASSQITVGSSTRGYDAVLVANNSASIFAMKNSAPSIQIGAANGSSIMQVNGGTVTTANQVFVGNTVAGYSAMSLNGVTLTVGSYFVVGFNNDRAVVNLNNSTLNSLATGNFITLLGGGGAGPNGYAVMNVKNSMVQANFTNNGPSIYVGESGPAILNLLDNSSFQAAGTLSYARLVEGNGVVNLNPNSFLSVQAITMNAAGTSVFNFNGGTLVANSAAGTGSTFMGGLTGAYIWGNSANIDDNQKAITISQNLLAPVGSGIDTINLTGATATGYIDTPAVLISGGLSATGSRATAIANINGSGQLTGITITSPGVGYTSNPTVTVYGGGVMAGNSSNGVDGVVVNLADLSASAGGLNKYDTGTLILSGNNTYRGNTYMHAGVLGISSNSNLGGPSSVLHMFDNGGPGGTLQALGSFSMGSRNIVLEGGSITLDTGSNNTVTIGGVISSPGSGSLTLVGGGKVLLNGTSSAPIFLTGNASSLGGLSNTGLGGTGMAIGSISLSNNTQLNFLDNHLGTLTLAGGLYSSGQPVFKFDLGGVSSSGFDYVNGTASTFYNNGGSITLFLNDLGVGNGVYNLMTFQTINNTSVSIGVDSSSLLGGATAIAGYSADGKSITVTISGAITAPLAYWSGAASSMTWTTVTGGISNFDDGYASNVHLTGVPISVTDVYFAASSQTANGVLATSLGADIGVKGVYVVSNMTYSVSIGGNNLYLGIDGFNMAQSAGALTVGSAVTLTDNQTWTNNNTNASLTVHGAISGAFNLNLSGNITVDNSANSFSGTVGILHGTVTAGTNGLGASTNVLNFSAGSMATLILNGTQSLAGLSGDATATITGGASGKLNLALTGTASFAGQMTGGLGLAVVSGTMTLSGTSSYTGATSVAGGSKLINGSSTALSAASNFTVSASGTLDMGGFNGSVANLALAGAVTNGAATAATLTVNPTADVTWTTGVFNDGTGKVGVVWNGTNNLYLAGQAMTYTGGFTLNGGQVFPYGNGAYSPAQDGVLITDLGAAGNTVTMNGGTININGSGIANTDVASRNYFFPVSMVLNGSGGTIYYHEGGVPHLGADGTAMTNTYDIAINGSSNAIMPQWTFKPIFVDGYLTGSGTLTVQDFAANGNLGLEFSHVTFRNTTTNNTFNGTLFIDNSTNGNGEYVQLTSGNIFANATVDTGPGTSTTASSTFAVAFADGVTTAQFGALAGTGNFKLTTFIGNDTQGILTNSTVGVALFVGSKNIATEYDGIMSGAGSLTIVGGTLALGWDNQYTGTTQINPSATLQIGTGLATGSMPAASGLTDNGTLAFNRIDNISFPNSIVGTGGVTQMAASTVTITGTSNYSGLTSILAGGTVAFAGGASHIIGMVAGTGHLLVAASTILVSKGVNLPAGELTVAGNQTISSSAAAAYAAFATGSGATVLSGTSKVSVISITGSLDIKNNALIIQTADTTSKVAMILALANTTNGMIPTGLITSSSAASSSRYRLSVLNNLPSLGATVFGGLPVDPNSVIVTETLKGDATIDGSVDLLDLARWKANAGHSNVYSPVGGDVNGDGGVDLLDLAVWKANAGHNLTNSPAPSDFSLGGLGALSVPAGGGASAVPEPASLAVLALGAVGLLTRRRRRMQNS